MITQEKMGRPRQAREGNVRQRDRGGGEWGRERWGGGERGGE